VTGSCRHGQVPFCCLDCFDAKQKLINQSRERLITKIVELEEENGQLINTINELESEDR
jgi:hypothetical protein